MEAITARKAEERSPIEGPGHALLILTYRCNLRCPYCLVFDPVRYWRFDPEAPLPKAVADSEMTTEQIVERVLPQCEKAGVKVVALTGGEVMVRRDAAEIFRALGESRLSWCMDTNMSRCSEEVAATIVDSRCDTVFASLDGARDVHNQMRASKRAYDQLARGMGNLVTARSAAPGAGPNIVVNCVLQHGNEEAPPEVVRLAAEWGVDGVAFQLLSARSYQPGFRAEAAAEAIRSARELAEDLGLRFSVFPVSHPDVDDLTSWFQSPPSSAFFQGCTYIHSSLRIDPAGNVIPCVENVAGNLLEEDLLEIWNGDTYRRFRDHIARSPLQACTRCCNMSAGPA